MSLKRLTLLYPPALEGPLVELLLEHRPELPGFTTVAAEGHGADLDDAGIREQVRGRVARGMLTMVLPAALVEVVLASLRARFAHSDVTWWVEPVEQFGDLG